MTMVHERADRLKSRARRRYPYGRAVIHPVSTNPSAEEQDWLVEWLSRNGDEIERLGLAVDVGPYPKAVRS
jgi:hypothetical protein